MLVFFHGGCEYNPVPSPGAQARYRALIDCGADAVVAAHTHCAQGWELYHGKPIVYSMGNLTFKHEFSNIPDSWFWGYVCRLTLTDDAETPFGVEAVPYRFDPETGDIRLMRGEDKARALALLDKLSALVKDEKTVSDLYDGWCMVSGLKGVRRLLQLTEEDVTPADAPLASASLAAVKNLFGCEAHNELMRRTTALLFTGRYAQALKHRDEILALQEAESALGRGE